MISGLTPFLEKVKKNEEEKTFFYYGEYLLDEIYDINGFFSSQKNEFFRVNQNIKGEKLNKYIILTDVYILLFDPVPDVFNYAKLIFFADIMSLNDIKEEKNEKLIYLEFNDDNRNIKLCFQFEKKYDDFIKGKNERINELKSKYKIFNLKDEENGINNIYNTYGFQISKLFESKLLS